MNADGTGSLTINTVNVSDSSCTPAQSPGGCASLEGPETYAVVVNNHRSDKLVSLIETDNVGGGAKIFLTGEAKKNSGSD